MTIYKLWFGITMLRAYKTAPDKWKINTKLKLSILREKLRKHESLPIDSIKTQ